MTHISDGHYQEDNSNATAGDLYLSMADHAALTREVQYEVGREMRKAIVAGSRRISAQSAKLAQALADLTRSPISRA